MKFAHKDRKQEAFHREYRKSKSEMNNLVSGTCKQNWLHQSNLSMMKHQKWPTIVTIRNIADDKRIHGFHSFSKNV
jgi:hypothetical protein